MLKTWNGCERRHNMGLKEYFDPALNLYSVEEISQELSIPVGAIEKYQNTGLIESALPYGPPMYSWKTVQFIQHHFVSTPMAYYWYSQNPKTA
jgi:hypothetical protein